MTTEGQEAGIAIRPFRIDVADDALADLRRRLATTRWHSPELVDDRSQGVQLETMQALVRYSATDHDWRACEAPLNALPQFTSEIDDVVLMRRLGHARNVAKGGDQGAPDRGGHFAAWEEPELFATQLRAAFAPMRAPGIPEPRR